MDLQPLAGLQFQQAQHNQQLAGQLTGQGQQLDTLMSKLSKVLTPQPIGTHYTPNMISPDITITGGQVPMVRRYTFIDGYKLAVPMKDTSGPVVGHDKFLEGDVSEADLIAAGANIEFLLLSGALVESGYQRI